MVSQERDNLPHGTETKGIVSIVYFWRNHVYNFHIHPFTPLLLSVRRLSIKHPSMGFDYSVSGRWLVGQTAELPCVEEHVTPQAGPPLQRL
jgi:hypothetical protein